MTDEPTIRIRDGSMVTREEYDMMDKQAQKAKANRQVKSDSSLSYSDLVDWLRDNAIGVVSFRPKFIEAANAIEALMARIAELEAALKQSARVEASLASRIANLMDALEPFADVKVYPVLEDTTRVYDEPITYGDLRAARAAALKETANG